MIEKKELPKYCPLFSIVDRGEGEYTECLEEQCQLYSTKMKMCAIVIQALAVSNINMRQVTEVLKGEKESRMESAKRQHRATD